jgi:squalene synthase HpnC
MAISTPHTEISYLPVLHFARTHYENFPVISFLIPQELQKHIAVIYWFARTADDLADEGDYTPEQRLEALEKFEARFNLMMNGNYETEFDILLHHTITSRDLTASLFTDLLSAFKQDVTKKRYSTYEEVKDYCRRSANPVGRLLLETYNIRNSEVFSYSDNICTALQLTNFYQDAGIDYEKGRIYFAADEMERFGVNEKSFEMKKINDNLRELVKYNIERTGNLYREGIKILPYLKGRLKLEIKWTIGGGMTVLKKIEKNKYDIFKRPALSRLDFAGIFLKSLVK